MAVHICDELRSGAVDHDSTGYLMDKAATVIDRMEAELRAVRAAFLACLKAENECYSFQHNKPCEAGRCGCLLEMQNYIEAEISPHS